MDQAVGVGDALAEVDQDNQAMFANDVAVILAEPGRAQQALARVEQNVRRFPTTCGHRSTPATCASPCLTTPAPSRRSATR